MSQYRAYFVLGATDPMGMSIDDDLFGPFSANFQGCLFADVESGGYLMSTSCREDEPDYDPKSGNTGPVTGFSNCYSYACNDHRKEKSVNPGNKYRYSNKTIKGYCDDLKAGVTADTNATETDCDTPCSCGHYKIALFTGVSFIADLNGKKLTYERLDDGRFVRRDYHFYRQDSNGMWSGKHGKQNASNLDFSGKTIIDPRDADRKFLLELSSGNFRLQDYDKLCSCFCVPKGGVELPKSQTK